jgi:DNA-binding NtrC family response regulator
MTLKLLAVDDDEINCRLVRAIAGPEGFDVIAAHDGPSGLERATSERPDLVILDLHLPGMDGIDVLEKLRASFPSLPVVMLTGHADLKTAVRATQLGAFDYLTKPVDHEELVLVIRRALEARELRDEVEDLRRRVGSGGGLEAQMGPSASIREVIDQVRVVASSDFTVLVLGETGTGKEVVAQAIHRQSERRSKPFVAVDCGAIPDTLLESELFGHEKGAFTGAERRKEGRFQLAEGGTFFLDEVGNLSLPLQAKLLRVLESRQVQSVGSSKARTMDVRFVAATNHDLQARVNEGRFRADLYFRLAQYSIKLPALRDRPSDVPFLVARFLEEATVELRRPVREIAATAMKTLQRHAWPGNVRELRNVVRQAVLQSRGFSIDAAEIDALLGRSAGAASRSSGDDFEVTSTLGKSLKEIAEEAAARAEQNAIRDVLRTTKGNKSQAAKALRTDYKTLHLKMKRFGIRAADFET